MILISGLSALSTLILSAMAVSGLVGSTTSMFRPTCEVSSGLVGVSSSTSSFTGPPTGAVAAVATAHSVIATAAVLLSRSSHKMLCL